MSVTVKQGKFWFNGEKQDFVVGRSSFKLSNIITHHYTGQGGGKYSLGYGKRWVEHNQAIFGEHVVLRVFLETAGWNEGIDGFPNGVPDGGMFGSEPADQGFWNVDTLRGGGRPETMHGVGRNVLEWFFKTSQETGVAFELCIIATLKHDDVSVGQQTHVIRQTLAEMRRLSAIYPKALVIPNAINEWNAHSQWSIQNVNMLATRCDRWKHPDGRTHVGLTAPNGFVAEQWPEASLIVDGGGGDMYEYTVGKQPGKFRAAMVHPQRGGDWWRMPNLEKLRGQHGMPIGFTESMYYVEQEDTARAEGWYRNRGGWSHDWKRMEGFYELWNGTIDYGIYHDEKGAQCDLAWPRKETRLEAWAKPGGVLPPPPSVPTPPPTTPPVIPAPPPVDIVKQLNRIEKAIGVNEKKLDILTGLLGGVLMPPAEPPDGDPSDEPDPRANPRNYISWDDRESWADRIFFAYTVWRGHRDLASITDKWLHTAAMSRSELNKTMDWMKEMYEIGKKLQQRILTERHKTHENRSQVRKVVAKEMESELKKATAEYAKIASRFPPVAGCDSIRCKVKSIG